jgi:hypothetical protein
MNDTQLLERFASAYATLDAPAPSATLAALMHAGEVTSDHEGDDDRRDAVVLPFRRPRSRVRMRYLVAALVASFVALSGLAAAGALPDPLQRQVSSVVSHLGIDLPTPAPAHGDGPTRAPAGPNGSERPSATSTTVATPGAAADDPGDAPGPATTGPGSAPPTALQAPALGDVGAVGGAGTPTTLPPGGGVELPPISVPPLTLPQITLPPLNLPPLTVPLLPLPPLPPLLGL